MTDRKIYYVQQFFNEKELLKIKMETIYPYVDKIILSESDRTHSGFEKPCYLAECFDMLDKFKDKLIIQFVRDTPSDYVNLKHGDDKDMWYNLVVDKINANTHYDHSIESYSRDSWEKEILIRPLAQDNPSSDDVVIFTDLDEVIKPETIKWLRENFDPNNIYRFECVVFNYALNLKTSEYWQSPIAASYQTFLENSFCEMRNFAQGILIKNSGYHFSYIGDPIKILQKLTSFGEQSLNLSWVRNNIPSAIQNAINYGRDIFGRPRTFEILEINYDNFPAYLVEHKEEFINLILPLDKRIILW